MGLRNGIILFFSTLSISLVVLLIFFNLFFKNMDVTFETHIPEAAPELGEYYRETEKKALPKGVTAFRAKGVMHANVNVPTEPRREEQQPEPEEEPEAPTPAASTPKPVIGPQTIKKKKRTFVPAAQKQFSAYLVYVDGFSSREEADKKVQALRKKGIESFVYKDGGRFIVKVGTFSSKENASALARRAGAKVRSL